MNDLADFITVAAAMAFTCAAFFLLGQTVGLGDVGLFSQYTFADVVDAAPSSILSMGIILSISLWTGERRRTELEKSAGVLIPISFRNWKVFANVALVTGAIVFVCYMRSHVLGISVGIVFVLAIAFYARLSPYLYNRLKRETASWIERWFWAAAMMFIWGCNSSSPAWLAPGSYLIRAETEISSPKILQLERGVVIVKDGGFDLIPWDKVRSISYRHINSFATPANVSLPRRAPMVPTTSQQQPATFVP